MPSGILDKVDAGLVGALTNAWRQLVAVVVRKESHLLKLACAMHQSQMRCAYGYVLLVVWFGMLVSTTRSNGPDGINHATLHVHTSYVSPHTHA